LYGKLGPTTSIDELDQGVQVIPSVVGDGGRELRREAGIDQSVAAPAGDGIDTLRTCLRVHDY
jgi:hypothetical protein